MGDPKQFHKLKLALHVLTMSVYFIFFPDGPYSTGVANIQSEEGDTPLWILASFPSSQYPKMPQAAALLLNASTDPDLASSAFSKNCALAVSVQCRDAIITCASVRQRK